MQLSSLKVFYPTLVILLLDQFSKWWVRASLFTGESHSLIGENFFRLTHVENTGVAFGMQVGGALFLALFNGVASIFLIYLLLTPHHRATARHPRLMEFALALILGGALGNLMDRLFFGRVTDFLDFDFPDFIMARWPVFNVADSAVSIGVTLWCLHVVFFSKPNAKAPPTSDTPSHS